MYLGNLSFQKGRLGLEPGRSCTATLAKDVQSDKIADRIQISWLCIPSEQVRDEIEMSYLMYHIYTSWNIYIMHAIHM